jgi:hypothetical protein
MDHNSSSGGGFQGSRISYEGNSLSTAGSKSDRGKESSSMQRAQPTEDLIVHCLFEDALFIFITFRHSAPRRGPRRVISARCQWQKER